MLAFIRKLLKKEDGATAIEYGLIAALIAVAIIAAAGSIGDSLDTMFTSVSTELESAVTPSAPAPAPAP
jgi:pilus assembly protein Flp/PilA